MTETDTYKKPTFQVRNKAIDITRGLIMVLMAIDHTSLFVAQRHPSEYWGVALPEYSHSWWFLCRFLSHISAPGFFFLMGVSLILFKASQEAIGISRKCICKRLILRGGILIFCEQLLANPAWILAPHIPEIHPGTNGPMMLHLGVLFSLGVSMILGGFLMWLPKSLLWVLGITSSLLPIILVPEASFAGSAVSPLLRILSVPGQTGIMFVLYPIFPWIGMTVLGMIFGKSYQKDKSIKIFQKGAIMGCFGMGIFFLLRFFDIGDFHDVQSGMIGFFNTTKYPASPAFISLFLGAILILLYLFQKINSYSMILRTLNSFGRSALFFYFIHLYILLLLGKMFPTGASIMMMSIVWFIALTLLYPLCFWYETFKRSKPPSSWVRMF